MQYMLPLLNMEAAPPPPSRSKPQHHQQQLMRTVSISILVMSLPVLYVSFLHVPPASLFRDTTFWFLMFNSIIIVIAADSGMLFFRSSSSSRTVDDDGLSFVVSADEPVAEAENSHASSTGVFVADGVVLPVDEFIMDKVMVVREHGDLTVIAENDEDDAYALVVRDDGQQGELQAASYPEAGREIKLSSPARAGELLAVEDVVDGGGAARARPSRLTASRSLAREERARRRHSYRTSHALVPVQDKRVVVVAREEKRQLRRAATAVSEETAEKESEYSMLSDEELNRRVEEFITKFNREIRLQLEKEQLALAAEAY